MSFLGKRWQKETFENVVELMDALNLDENIRALLDKPDSIAYFLQNDDGSFQHVAELNGNKVYDQKVVLDEETEFNAPAGITATQLATLEGDTLKIVYTDTANGHSLTFVREFEDESMTLTITGDFFDVAATIGYKLVE